MCVIERLQIPTWNPNFIESYTTTIWLIGLFVLVYWIFELLFIRNIFRCSSKRFKKWIKSLLSCEAATCCNLKLPIAFLMILLSTLTSLLSSTLFLYSSHNANNGPNMNCSYAPITAILLRFISKHFIWGFNIVRGQMVIEMLQNKYLNIFVKHSPYILTIQMIIIFILVFIFHSSTYDTSIGQCSTEIPLILLILTAFIGEFIYGIGFVYIFVKSMTKSMQRVMISLRDKEKQRTKKQLFHHLTVYLIQFILSSFYIISISTCCHTNTFTNFQIFAAELLISNMCVLTLFRGRTKKFKKQCMCFTSHEKQLIKYVSSASAIREDNYGNGKHPVLVPTLVPTLSTDIDVDNYNDISTKKEEDMLADLQQIQLSDIGKSTISPPIWSRNNSISTNPLLPNSWLSPRLIETFRTSLVPKQMHMNTMSDLNNINIAIDDCISQKSRSAPILNNNNTANQSKHKYKYKYNLRSQSASVIDRKCALIETELEREKEDDFVNTYEMKVTSPKSCREEVMAICRMNNDKTVNKSNSFILSIASKSMFKRATLLFTRSHSTPLSDLAATAAIPAILSLEEKLKLSNTAENKESDHSLEIIYSDEVMDGVAQ